MGNNPQFDSFQDPYWVSLHVKVYVYIYELTPFKTITLVYTGILFSMGDYPNLTVLNTIKCLVEIFTSFKTIQGIYIIYCEIKFFQDHLDKKIE